MTKHFRKGGSAAERFIECVGSSTLVTALGLPPSDEPDYQKGGTAAHAVLAEVLAIPEMEAWEAAGRRFGDDVVADAEMVAAVDVAVGVCRPLVTPAVKVYIEHFFHIPDVHPEFGGTVDFATVSDSLLNVVDYKHGEGVVVDVEDNPQLMYYAYGLLLKHPEVRRVVLRIIQPRAFHPDGPVRRWETTADHIHEWANEVLIPAMYNVSKDLSAGKWCRFCPAKLVCPLMTSLFEAASTHDPKSVVTLDDRAIGQSFQLIEAVHSYTKALREETHRRNMLGKKIAGTKVVASKTNRIFKAGAEAAFRKRFGQEAFETPNLRSPAQMEEISSEAKMLVKKWAYTPPGGPTTVLETDRRTALRVKSLEEQYASVLKENGS